MKKRAGIRKTVGNKELRAYIVGRDPIHRWILVQVQEKIGHHVTFTSDPIRVVVPLVREFPGVKDELAMNRSDYAFLGSQFMPLVGLYLDAQQDAEMRQHFVATLANAMNLQVRQARHPRPVGGDS